LRQAGDASSPCRPPDPGRGRRSRLMRRETGAQAATAAPRWPRAEFLSVYDRTAWFGPLFGLAVVAREYAVICWGIRGARVVLPGVEEGQRAVILRLMDLGA